MGLLLLIVTCIVSYGAMKDNAFFERYAFKTDPILIEKDYKRLFSSGFIHANWTHLIFNMVTLYAFIEILERSSGSGNFLLIYLGSLLGGNLFSLYVHRNHSGYTAVGASGAVSGIIFASIALAPGLELGLILIPIYIPSWLFGLLFVLISIFGIKSQKGNIGHDAHLGGALVGLLITIALHPIVLRENLTPILIIIIPSVLFLYLMITRPEFLIINSFSKAPEYESIDHKFNTGKKAEAEQMDQLLDKISEKGIDSLTKKEKDKLERLSGKEKED